MDLEKLFDTLEEIKLNYGNIDCFDFDTLSSFNIFLHIIS